MSNIANKILKLVSSQRTVFTTNELAIIWGIEKKNVLLVVITRAVKDGYLLKIRRGLYSLKDSDVAVFELACKLKKHSYISFETVLAEAGVIHQWHDKIYLANKRSDEIRNSFGVFCYRDLPEKILLDNKGIINKGNYFVACAERALCDKVYKDGISFFDDLSGLNKDLVLDISRSYNKRTHKDIKKIFYDNK
jgi:predicted transcriptional regulator of viral defense system